MAINKTDSEYLRHQSKPFLVIMNDVAQGVSNPDALAIWVYLQSKSSGWKVIASHIQKHFGLGRDRYRAAMRYLHQHGLIEYQTTRDQQGRMLGKEIVVNWKIAQPNVQETECTVNPQCGETTPYEKKEVITKEKIETKCANALRDAFDEFWQSVPNKKDKARARRFFEREAKKYGDPAAFADMVIDDMRARLESGQQGFDLIHPSTYLNNRRWEDERPLACPHKKIVKLWNETLPDHIEKVTPDDWTPRHPGFAVLAQSWEVFKTKPRATTGKPVFDTEDRGLEFYRETFKRLAKTHHANREGSERFITLRWAAEQHNTTKIFKGEIQ